MGRQPDEAPVVVGFFDPVHVGTGTQSTAEYELFVRSGGIRNNRMTAFALCTDYYMMMKLGIPAPLPRIVAFWFDDEDTEFSLRDRFYMRQAGFFDQGDGAIYVNGELPVLATLFAPNATSA